MDVPYFSLFGGSLPYDFMHDVLEGVALHETSLLLHYCISEAKYFTLSEYNESLTNFDYEYTESDKPAPISRNTLASDAKLRLTASQSLLLVRILPLLVGGKVPESDQKWQCFLILQSLTYVRAQFPLWSKALFRRGHDSKIHYLIHYPDQICQVGPMQRTWTMRHEAKLNMFKRAAWLGNFKNIALSLALRHQRLLCYELSTGRLLEAPMETGRDHAQTLV